MVDLTAYMVEAPVAVQTMDRVSKVLNLFRLMQLKILPVVDGDVVKGLITRHNLVKHTIQ